MSVRRGFDRYYCSKEIIFKAISFSEAEWMIDKKIEFYKKHKINPESFYYYNKDDLWLEVQTLFSIQYVEFRLSEIFAYLHKNNLIQNADDFIEKIIDKVPDKNLSEIKIKKERCLTPRALLNWRKYNLGNLIRILENNTNKFYRKEELIENLNLFNNERNDFIHRSFSNETDINATMSFIKKYSKELINIIEDIECHYFR